MDNELVNLEKVNNDNKLELAKVEERLSNLSKEKEEVEKTIKDMGIDIEEAEMVLETSEEEYKTLLVDAKTKLGVA